MQIKFINVLCAVFFIITSVFGDVSEGVKLNDKGVNSLNQQDFVSAIYYLELATKESPKNEIVIRNLINAYFGVSVQLAGQNLMNDACNYGEKAYKLLPTDSSTIQSLSILYYKKAADCFNKKQYSDSEKALLRVQGLLNDKSLPALIMLGKIAYNNQKLQDAEKYWSDALKLDPENNEIRELIATIKKEGLTENKFSQVQGDKFEIHYDQNVVKGEIYDIRQHLMDCYREVGQDFSYFPKHPVIVLLYSENEFRGAFNVRSQVAGFYDGKIRLPVNYRKYPLSTLKQVLRHEYTHALIYDIAGSHIPIWLHEGLAVYEEKTTNANEANLIRNALRNNELFTFDELSLTNVWKINDNTFLAYAQAHAIVEYMVNRWGLYVITQCINQCNSGSSFEYILNKNTNCTLDELDRSWKMKYSR